jgi:hypothetical protein
MRRVIIHGRRWLVLAAILLALASLGACGGEAEVVIGGATPTPTPRGD